MSEKTDHEELISIMVLGNSSVGKTSFILRFTENEYKDTYISTIGIDFKIKYIKINDIRYKVLFYDTAGQERFHSIAPSIIKKVHGIIIMYDITDILSFDSIREIIESIKEEKGKDFPMILIGNKIDLEIERLIKKEEAEELAEKYGMEFFEISNKEGINIEKAGLSIVNKILEKRKNDCNNIENLDWSIISDLSYHSKYSNIDNDQHNKHNCC